MRIIGIDPSGNFHEGKGVTGIVVIDENAQLIYQGTVRAEEYATQLEYWQAHLLLLNKLAMEYLPAHKVYVSIEDYILYASAAKAQINSGLETPKLIGALMMWSLNTGIPLYMRTASQVVNRWNNKILQKKGLLIPNEHGGWKTAIGPINQHAIDALRHALHCRYFETDKSKKCLTGGHRCAK